MKKFLSIVSLFLLVACGPAAKQTSAPIEFTVGSFNMRGDIDKGDNSWKMRKPRVAERIKEAAYDIFGTQECYGYMLEDVHLMLPQYDYYGQCTGDKTATYSAFFYNTERLELLESGDFWYSDTPSRISNGWHLNYLRICSWGKLRDRASGKVFYFFNTHLDNKGKKSVEESMALRVKCAALLLERMKAIAGDSPRLLTGDLNGVPESDAMHMLAEQLQDSYKVTQTPPQGPKGTFHGFKPTPEAASRIDYIYASSQFTVLSYRCVDTDITEGHCASDHFSIMSKLSLQ